MKLPHIALALATLVCSIVLAMQGQLHQAWVVLFIGTAASVPWSEYRTGRFATNTIADGLTLTRVLENALIGFKTALAPLGVFSTAAVKDPAGAGNDSDNSVSVPVSD